MLYSYPVGLPGLAALALGFLAFVVAVLFARMRRGAADRGPQRRSQRSIVGIAVQCLAFFLTAFGIGSAMLDPLSPLALGEAVVIALLMAASVALFAWASRTMGRNWSVVARTRSDHTLVTTGPFPYHDEWRQLIASMEATLRLHSHEAGSLVASAKYLHQRTGGMIGSLSHLIRAAAIRAILSETEAITVPLLDKVRIDHAAESAARRSISGR